MQLQLRPWQSSLALGVLAAASARAQTVFVDTASNDIDFSGAMQVSDLPGPDGKVSLGEAAIASDNTPGVQTIGFHVPQSEWTMQAFYPGRAVLTPFLGFTVFESVILDGTTQTAFTGDTHAGGAEVLILTQVYLNNSVGSVVLGLDNTVIVFAGGMNNVVQANTNVGVDVNNSTGTLIGGTNPGEGNTAGYIKLTSARDCVVVGNITQRVRVLGNGPFQPPTRNNRIGGPTPAERNFITGTGTWTNGSGSSGGIPTGIAVELQQAEGTLIENNWIGTTPDGLAQGHPATVVGILLWEGNVNTVIRGNRIAGIFAAGLGFWSSSRFGVGIQLNGAGNGLSIVGNTIGLDATGAPVLGSVTGILSIHDPAGPLLNVVIGTGTAGQGNVIAGNSQAGIRLSNGSLGVRLSGNAIYDNGGLGIDLVDAGFNQGVTPNDPLDGDSGANGLQNFPVLQSATMGGGSVTVAGTFNSAAAQVYTLEFFFSPQCDPTGHGEGRQYLGATVVTTDSAGNAAFSTPLQGVVAPGAFVTATATAHVTGSTSEFSACQVVAAGGGALGVSYCGPANVNSTGASGRISAFGSAVAAVNDATLTADRLPANALGFFLASRTQGLLANPGGSQGDLCLAGAIGRYVAPGQVQSSGGLGILTLVLDLTRTPQPVGVVPVLAGETWNFQAWHRDTSAMGATSNFTDGLEIDFH